MRRAALLALVALAALGGGCGGEGVRRAASAATVAATSPAVPVDAAPVPRVCWGHGHAGGVVRLANLCRYDVRRDRWLARVDGRLVPARRLSLPVANLCVYFAGTRCPEGVASGQRR